MSEAQACEGELADASGLTLKQSNEFLGRQAGGRDLSYTRVDQKSYLRSKRQKYMKYGEATSLLRYFQQQLWENPSFYYAVQLDTEEQITNIFWADARMWIDYDEFGDVVIFDATYKTNKAYRPCVLDVVNIKMIPEEYILKRWTTDARKGNVQEMNNQDIQGDPKMKVTKRYRMLCSNFVRIAARAAEFDEAFNYVAKVSIDLVKKVEELCSKQLKEGPSSFLGAKERVEQIDNMEILNGIGAKGIKMRDHGNKSRKRERSWVDKLYGKKRGPTRFHSAKTKVACNSANMHEQSIDLPQETNPRVIIGA
ncbi:hypothetical protein F0562_023546 [Nyssa sinensis]|uniref:Uncharacterized protein n=1 Tax=Nyssa sinensis TaxID=561372 RepID=A0A5J5BI65_9ASTE|nr:hypothetical protein F0562_023546 [Nyssa sinensis]